MITSIGPAEWLDLCAVTICVMESIPAVWFLLLYRGAWSKPLPLLLRSSPVLALLRASVRFYFLTVLGGYRAVLPFGPWTSVGPDLIVGGMTVVYTWFYLWVFLKAQEPHRGEWRR